MLRFDILQDQKDCTKYFVFCAFRNEYDYENEKYNKIFKLISKLKKNNKLQLE